MNIRESLAQIQFTIRQRDVGYVLAVVYAVFIGLILRLFFVLSADFPLNDGGMFYAMVRDLQRSHYVLPEYTSYNSAAIPFAYPPLALYVAGLIEDLTPWSLLDVLRFLPLITNTLAIVAFFFIARSMLSSKNAAIFSVFAFALFPRSFETLIMGGGLTRSLGFLFAILALHQVYLLYTRHAMKHLVPAIASAGCTVLSHPTIGWFAAFSIAILFLAYGRNRRAVVNSTLLAIGTLAVTAPWWATVMARHGAAPFLAASEQSSPLYGGILDLLSLNLSSERLFPLLGFLALLGLLACLVNRRFFIPAWLAVMFVLGLRSATARVIPLSLLAGIGTNEVLLPLLNSARHLAGTFRDYSEKAHDVQGTKLLANRLAEVVLFCMLVYVFFSAIVGLGTMLTGLSRGEREAMRWIASNTPESSVFLVLTPDDWIVDRSSEWFPTLANRQSVATVQGHEWLGGFARHVDQNRALGKCARGGGVSCLTSWAKETGVSFTHVYVPKRPPVYMTYSNIKDEWYRCLLDSLRDHPSYLLLYDEPGASVFKLVSEIDK